MLTEQSVDKLKALIETHAGPDKDELIASLEDISRMIGTQTLLIRNMRIELENANVSQMVISQIVEQNTLNSMLANFTPAKRNPFSMDEAKIASDQLVAKVNSANDFAEILKGLVQVAKVFI
ncbi:MAG: hypothetical protein ACW963_04440 [Candidatus Sifarchaeia archaeon]|jgi:hypothetical protein